LIHIKKVAGLILGPELEEANLPSNTEAGNNMPEVTK
jgi:hypothetical protein